MKPLLQLAPIFSDNMVIQRGSCIPVWGSMSSGMRIRVTIGENSVSTTAVDGRWSVTLPPMSAGKPVEMKVEGGTASILLRNVLIGEVWIAGGQSNMEFALKDSLGGEQEISKSTNDQIRYFQVPKIAFENDDTSMQPSGWHLCRPEHSGDFSAVAYYFAQSLYHQLRVPVGIIGCNWGSTSASCWMSRERLKNSAMLKSMLNVENSYPSSDEEYDRQLRDYETKASEYARKAESLKKAFPNISLELMNEKLGPDPWPPPMGRKSFRRPGGLYETMLHPIIPYAIKGVIWYQGEEDVSKASLYSTLFQALIENWRSDWKQPELPFLFVQLPYFGDGISDEWAQLREAQMEVAESEHNTAMVVAIDCGEKHNIHPVNKKPVGNRLALAALARVYGYEVEYSGPLYWHMTTDHGAAYLSFKHAQSGLIAEGNNLNGFEICGNDHIFFSADASIEGQTVKVFSAAVPNPIAVRYGWMSYGQLHLKNAEGLPAAPFRTDRFHLEHCSNAKAL